MKSVRLGFKLTESSARVATALSNPAAWAAYRQKVLRQITEQAKAAIQRHASGLWKNPTGLLDNSWFTSYSGNTGTIYNTKQYAYWLNFGVRPHQMTYLLNSDERTYMAWGRYPFQARPPIPLKIAGNRLFRRATIEGMQAGKWRHPGFTALSFVENGMEWYRTNQMPRDVSGLLVEVIQGNT